MPFINIKANFELKSEEIENLKSFFGDKITLLPGKSERWLMVNVEDKQNLFFKGTEEKAVYIEVKVYGDIDSYNADRLTNEATKYIVSRLNVNSDRIYVGYYSTFDWGYNGNNF